MNRLSGCTQRDHGSYGGKGFVGEKDYVRLVNGDGSNRLRLRGQGCPSINGIVFNRIDAFAKQGLGLGHTSVPFLSGNLKYS